MIARALASCIAVTGIAGFCTSPARAQDPGQFYKGKTIELYIGFFVGAGYDQRARMLARHMGKHIPGHPVIVPKNMDGAASLRLANWLANVAPRNGTVFGMIARGAAFDPLLGQKAAQFNGSDFGWIGSPSDETSVCAVMSKSGIATFEDALAREVVVGSVGMADGGQFPRILNGMLGSKFKLIPGYKGSSEIVLAMERGEVEGRCGWSWGSIRSAYKHWVDQKVINALLQFGLARHPELADVPLVLDLAKNDEQRQIMKLVFARQAMGWPFVTPPGVRKDLVDTLRKAFMATMQDKEFLAEAAKAKLEIRPVSGGQLHDLVKETYATPQPVVQKAGELLSATD